MTHCDRAEMDVAANGSQVVQVTWQNVRVYDYSGRLLHSTPMTTFIRNAGLNPIPPKEQGPLEPHVVFDEFIGRWILTVTCLNDCVLVSASSDASGAWGGVYLSCLEGGPCLNYEASIHIGYDKNGVYDCSAHLGDENPATVPRVAEDCFAIPPAEAAAIAQGTPPAHIHRVHNMPLDVMPAIDHNRSKAARALAFFLNKSCGHNAPNACQNSTNYPVEWVVNTFTWSGATGTWNAGGRQQSVKSGWLYNTPCCGELSLLPQAGNETVGLRVALSHRLENVVQYVAHLHGVLGSGPCSSACGAQGADAGNVMFWVDLDCSKPAACKVARTAKIASAEVNPVFATVGVDASGSVGIVAASSTAKTDLSLLLWTRRKGDPANKFTGPTPIVSGTKPYTCLNVRNMAFLSNSVGVLTALDPSDGTKLCTTEQY